jgi:hypothetical protein
VPFGRGIWRLEDARTVLQAYRELVSHAPDEFKATAFFCGAPEVQGVSSELLGRPVLMTYQVWAEDDLAAARRTFDVLTLSAPPLAATMGLMPWLDVQSIDDVGSRHGQGNYTKGGYLRDLGDGVIAEFIEAARGLPNEQSGMEVIPHGGAQLNVSEEASAFSDRDAAFSLKILGRWQTGESPDILVDWARASHRAIHRFASGGVYTNFFAADDGHDMVLAAYGRAKYARLSEIKARCDLKMFSLEHSSGQRRPSSSLVSILVDGHECH